MDWTRRSLFQGAAGLTCAALMGCSRADKSAPRAGAGETSTGTGTDATPAPEREASGAPAVAAASALERLEAVGTPRLRGQIQGAALRDAIAANVAAFMAQTQRLRADKSAVARWDAAVDAGQRRLASAPALVEELEGMGMEAGVDARAHLAFALGPEVLAALEREAAREHIDRWWASDVAAVPNVTGRVTRVAFALRGSQRLCVVDHLDASREPVGLIAGHAGTLGAFGVGTSGVACAVQPLLDCTPVPDGRPISAAFRTALTTTDHHGAARVASEARLAASACIFVADPTKGLSVESRPEGIRTLGTFARSAVVAHTNHAVGPVKDEDPRLRASLARLKALRSVIPAGSDPELDVFVKAMIDGPLRDALSPGHPLFAANLKPAGTQMSWRWSAG